MSVPNSIVGAVFTSTEVSEGTVSGTNPVSFTETKLLSNQSVFGSAIGPNATATVMAVGTDTTNGDQTVTVQINNSGTLADGQSITGDVIGNDAADLLLSGNLLGTQAYLYVTNTPGQQPGVGNAAEVAAEATAPAYQPPCYCPGTLIRTEAGDVPVEHLAAGDIVVTASGAPRPVRWVGRRSYAARFAATNPALRPVVFRQGSLGSGLPLRDLSVSPEHAMFVDGVLVPARLLVNDATIVQERSRGDVHYIHVELDSHDLLLAEGTASESFVDDGSRGMFHNAAEFHALYPDAAPDQAAYCAPRVEDGPALKRICGKLRPRATA